MRRCYMLWNPSLGDNSSHSIIGLYYDWASAKAQMDTIVQARAHLPWIQRVVANDSYVEYCAEFNFPAYHIAIQKMQYQSSACNTVYILEDDPLYGGAPVFHLLASERQVQDYIIGRMTPFGLTIPEMEIRTQCRENKFLSAYEHVDGEEGPGVRVGVFSWQLVKIK